MDVKSTERGVVVVGVSDILPEGTTEGISDRALEIKCGFSFDSSSMARISYKHSVGAKTWRHTFLFLKLFGHRLDIPAKSRDIPPKKVWFSWFRGTYRTFWPPPLRVEDPYHPTGKYPDSKVWVCALFSCLVNLCLQNRGFCEFDSVWDGTYFFKVNAPSSFKNGLSGPLSLRA